MQVKRYHMVNNLIQQKYCSIEEKLYYKVLTFIQHSKKEDKVTHLVVKNLLALSVLCKKFLATVNAILADSFITSPR